MIGNRFYTWFKNYYQWVGGAFNETLLLPLVRATAGLRAGAIRYDQATNTVETYDGTNWNAIPSASGFVPNSRTITINGTTFDLSTNRIYSVGTVTSVGLSMPAAFTVSGSPVTGSGTLSVAGAGLASQYVRGDGTLANFPTSQGGGSSVSYYLNGSVNQGSFGGSTYYEMNRTPVLGAGTNFSRNTDGYIASFITDANDPALTEIPGGNFNLELYFSASSGGGNPSFYVEFYKYDGTTFSLIASNSTSPDSIVGATKDAYFTAIAVPQTALNITDRLVIRVYVNTSGRTIMLHTEDQNLCQVITTFSTGINTINGLTKQVQFLTTGTSGTDFNINSTNSTHTFNIPTASATNRGALSSADWTTFNNKVSTSRQLTINGTAFDLSADRSWNVGTVTSVGLDTGSAGTDINVSGSPVSVSGNITLNIPTASATNRGALSAADWAIFNAKQNALTLTTTGNSGASTLVGATINVPEYTLSGLGGVPTTRTLTINGTALDLSANRSWSVGTVTSVGLTSATSGITISDSPVTVSGTIGIAIATANGSQQGLLSSTDWTTFNNKQNALTLTTNGTSGAATLIGATLNVPQYQAQGNYITSLTGEATASGPGAASVTLSTTAVTGKLLTGLNLSGGGTIAATDSILQAFGKVQNQISAMVGGVMYQGTWNASTNTPTLTSSVGTKGNYYIVDVSGTTNLNGITDWRVGDWAIFNGSTWDKVDNTDAVSSVNGFTGAVSLTTSHIAEGTNLYYLDSRSRTAISLTTTGSSGAATYDNVSGIINVPQYTLSGLGGVPSTRQLTINGTAFDLSADRSWSVGTVTSVGLNSTTSGITITNTPVTSSGALTINIATASGSQNGLLSSTDWTTFNNKQNALTNPVTGTGVSGQLAYFNGTSTITGESNLFWNESTNCLGIRTNTPTFALEVNGNAFIGDNTFIGNGGELRFSANAINIKPVLVSSVWSDLAFTTNSVERMRITSGGNVGIGTTTPAGPLQVVGTADQIRSGNGTVTAFLGGSGSNGYTGTLTNHAFQIYTNSVDRINITAAGNVGIGTSSPGARLSVYQNNPTTGILFEIFNNASSSHTGAIMKFTQNGVADWGIGQPAGTDAFAFWSGTFSGNLGTERMRITSGGNVGIGNPAPTYTLEVNSGASQYVNARFYGSSHSLLMLESTTAARQAILVHKSPTREWTVGLETNGNYIWYDNTAAAHRMRLDNSGNLGLGVTPSAWASPFKVIQINEASFGSQTNAQVAHMWSNVFYDGGVSYKYIANNFATHYRQFDGKHEWYTAPSGTAGNAITFTQAMTLDASGNLLVGVTTASYSATNRGVINVGGTSGGLLSLISGSNKGYLFQSGTDLLIENDTTTGAMIFGTNASTERMRITSGGNVGIGTSSPAVALQVIGDIATSTRLAADTINGYTGGSTPLTIQTGGAQNIIFGTSATERMRITSGGSIGIGTNSPDIFGRGDGFDVGISSAGLGASQNMSLQLNAGGSAGRGAQIYMGQGGTRHFTISSNATESTIGTTSNTPLRIETNSVERMRIHSNGGLRYVPQSAAPTAEAGTVYYDSDDNKLKVYNGTSWVDLH